LGVGRVDICDTIVAIFSGENTLIKVVVVPNPFHEQTTITVMGHQDYEQLEVLIFNVFGQKIRRLNTSYLLIKWVS
jgi:hypothetical protein